MIIFIDEVISLYTQDAHTIDVLYQLWPYFCIERTMGSIIGSINGVIVGLGIQGKMFWIQLAYYYALGGPSCIFFAFYLGMQAPGLFLSTNIIMVAFVITIIVIVWRADWQRIAELAFLRMSKSRQLIDDKDE